MYWSAWCLRSEFYAVRTLGWPSARFWGLTIREFNLIVEGSSINQRKALEHTAHFVTVVVNSIPSFSKTKRKGLTVDNVIGMSPEKKRALRKLARRRMREARETREARDKESS